MGTPSTVSVVSAIRLCRSVAEAHVRHGVVAIPVDLN